MNLDHVSEYQRDQWVSFKAIEQACRQLTDLQALRATVAQLREEAGLANPATCASEAICRYL